MSATHPTPSPGPKDFEATDVILADREDDGLLAATAKVKLLTEGRGAD